jgi:hypothetical protein
MVATKQGTKEKVIALLDELPESALAEIVSFVEFLQYKLSAGKNKPPNPVPVKLGGLLAGTDITGEDIAEIRHEMWGGIEDRVP